MTKLTKEQVQEVIADTKIDNEKVPVRFLDNGQNVNISSGERLPKNTNVIYHHVYWNFSKDTANKISKYLNVKPVFSE